MGMKTGKKWAIVLSIVLLVLLIPLFLRHPETPESSPALPQETQTAPTAIEFQPPVETTASPVSLQSLLGSNYVQLISDTITMQMGNRMDKNPSISYYPIAENQPLSHYVQIGPDTAFEVDESGCLIIQLPAGSVTSEEHGIQEFRIGVFP